MAKSDFTHVTTWVFDLDNTLYPPAARLFDQIEARMTAYVMSTLSVPREEADRLRADYWRLYGTTLAGLMHEHGVDPVPYLEDVHDIALDHLAPDPALARAIAALPGPIARRTHFSACRSTSQATRCSRISSPASAASRSAILYTAFGDLHINSNHLDQVNELLAREPLELPRLEFVNAESLTGLDGLLNFKFENLKLQNYQSYGKSAGPVAV